MLSHPPVGIGEGVGTYCHPGRGSGLAGILHGANHQRIVAGVAGVGTQRKEEVLVAAIAGHDLLRL